MGIITQRTARCYSGLDADKASIPAAAKAVNDLFFATDTGIAYRWDGAAWVLNVPALSITKAKAEIGFGRYVPLYKTAWDWVTGDFTFDGTFKVNALDITTKGVPLGAIGAMLRMSSNDDVVGFEFIVCPDKDTGDMSGITLQILVANVWLNQYGIIPVPADGLLDYYGAAGLNNGFVCVTGYFI